ncbi:MAG: hypothetical protein OWQ54_07005 [Sulfolobaceae archaeon]|nr:hypothetical protein [Sulfolobaceae archaeon]
MKTSKRFNRGISTIIGSIIFIQIIILSIIAVIVITNRYFSSEMLVYNHVINSASNPPLIEYSDGSETYLVSTKPELIKYIILPNGKILNENIIINGKLPISYLLNSNEWAIVVLGDGQWFNISYLPTLSQELGSLLTTMNFAGIYNIPPALVNQLIVFLPQGNGGNILVNYPTAIYVPPYGLNYVLENISDLAGYTSGLDYFRQVDGAFVPVTKYMYGLVWVTNSTLREYFDGNSLNFIIYFPLVDFVHNVHKGKIGNYYGNYLEFPSFASVIFPVNITNDMYMPLGILSFSFLYNISGNLYYLGFYFNGVTWASPLYGYYTAPTGFIAPPWNTSTYSMANQIVISQSKDVEAIWSSNDNYRYAVNNTVVLLPNYNSYLPIDNTNLSYYINYIPLTGIISEAWAWLNNYSSYNKNWSISKFLNEYSLRPLNLIHQQNFFEQLLIIPWSYNPTTGQITVALALVGSSDLQKYTDNYWCLGGYDGHTYSQQIHIIADGYTIYTIEYFTYDISSSILSQNNGVILAFSLNSNSTGDYISSFAVVDGKSYIGIGNFTYYLFKINRDDTLTYNGSYTISGYKIPIGYPYVVFTGYKEFKYVPYGVSADGISNNSYELLEVPTAYVNNYLGIDFTSPFNIYMPPLESGLVYEYVYDNPNYNYNYYGWIAIGNYSLVA